MLTKEAAKTKVNLTLSGKQKQQLQNLVWTFEKGKDSVLVLDFDYPIQVEFQHQDTAESSEGG